MIKDVRPPSSSPRRSESSPPGNAARSGDHAPPDRKVRQPAGARSGPPAELPELSDRELEVIKLIARGLSNGEIALSPFVTEATVKTHVTHMFHQAGAPRPRPGSVLAYESGLVRPGITD